jgi:hypothetical protein
MRIEKQKLLELENCYAVSAMTIKGRLKYFFAANNNTPCRAYDPSDKTSAIVWENAGGTMSMIPLHGTDGEFLAVHGFMPRFMAAGTSIAWAKPEGEGYDVKALFKLPYIHRFDVFEADGVRYILVCTIATTKKDFEDWSDPGKLWAGVLPRDLNETVELKPIKEGLFKNHGYCRVNWNGRDAALISSELGVMSVTPPQEKGGEWTVETVIPKPVSDIALLDIDGDGREEIAAIEPFHGDTFAIYKSIAGVWEKVYTYENKLTLGHVAYACRLRGVPTFIGGEMQGAGELFYVQCESAAPLKFTTRLIDKGGKPSNVTVINNKDNDIILAANCGTGEAVMYTVTD